MGDDGPGTNRDVPTLVTSPVEETIIAVDAGYLFSLILAGVTFLLWRYFLISFIESGRVYSFGNNYYGQLGQGDNGDTGVYNRKVPTLISELENEVVVSISAGHSHSLVMTGSHG